MSGRAVLGDGAGGAEWSAYERQWVAARQYQRRHRDAFLRAERLLAETVQLAGERTGADLSSFRDALAERRQPASPSPQN